MDDDAPLLTIGQLGALTGLAVRTIRFWSDCGLVPPARRTASGRRLYDAQSLARLELVATLRELGLSLADVREVAEKKTALADVASVHIEALDTQIRTLRLRRSVLAVVANRAPGNEEMTLMNKLAKLSAAERKQIIDDFVDEVFHGLQPDPGLAARLRTAPNLPDDPTPEQVNAWIELAELIADPAFRQRIRDMAGHAAQAQAGQEPPGYGPGSAEFASRVLEHAGAARDQGTAPDSAEAVPVLDAILSGTPGSQHRHQLLAQLEAGTDARAERYWQLVGIINGWPPFPAHVPAFQWLIAALRTHR